jgi:hypothetical protein
LTAALAHLVLNLTMYLTSFIQVREDEGGHGHIHHHAADSGKQIRIMYNRGGFQFFVEIKAI